jgi:hypothetical protein
VFDQLREKIDPRQEKKISQVLLKSRMSLSQDKRSEIEAAIFDLNSISHTLSELMLDQSAESSG